MQTYRVYSAIISCLQKIKCLSNSKQKQSHERTTEGNTWSSSSTHGSQRELPKFIPPRIGFDTRRPEFPSLRYSAFERATDSRRHWGAFARFSSTILLMLDGIYDTFDCQNSAMNHCPSDSPQIIRNLCLTTSVGQSTRNLC